MKIKINNQEKDVSLDTTLVKLLQEMNLTGNRGLAVAVNQEVINSDQWEEYQLKDNDSVLVLHAIAGG